MTGYVPPREPKTSPVVSIGQHVQAAASGVIRSVAAVVENLAKKKPLHVCLKCDAEFARYDVLGKCPLCGEWAIVHCES